MREPTINEMSEELGRCLARAAELITQLAMAAHQSARNAEQQIGTQTAASPVTPLLIDSGETARLLGCHPRTLDTLEDRGELRPIRIGGRSKRWAVADVEAYIAKQQQAAKAA
jgi:predicted DNA-binding transcriptional regulator AlpA